MCAARPAAAQSAQLRILERATPAVAGEPLSALAWGGWSGAWLAPAAGDSTTGFVLGVEHNGFASLTNTLLGARFRLGGPIWQVAVGQTSVGDLFDEQLLEEFPSLGDLNVSATQFSADGVLPLGRAVNVSVGIRFARDEILGDAEHVWAVRASTWVRLPGRLAAALTMERAVVADDAGSGRLTGGVGSKFGGRDIMFDLGVGARIDDLWKTGRAGVALAGGLRAGLFGLVSVYGGAGVERDPFEDAGWLGFASFGFGLTLGPIAAHARRGGQGTSEAAPTAVSLLYAPAPSR